jgi:hypothetical protein
MNAIQIAEIAESWVAAKMDAYIEKVAEVYSLSVEELKGIAKDVTVPSSCDAANVLEKKKLMKLKKVELQAKCKELGHRVTGNKSELCDRILSGAAKSNDTGKNKSKKTKPKSKQEENLRVCKSKYGNYTYDALVIDKGTRMVVGIELDDGTIGPLTKAGIEKCHRYKLKFAIPLNLDATEEKSNSEEEEEELECIEEIEEEEEEEEIEEEEEEEEEEEDNDDDEEIEIEEDDEEEIEEENDTNVGDDENEDDEDIEYEVYDD